VATLGLTSDQQKAVEQFRQDVVLPSMEKLVILDFWAEWCGPCKQLTPILEKIASEYAEKGVHLVKVNVDENGFIASQFQVRSIPTVFALFQGKPVADLTSARTEAQIAQALDQILGQLPVTPGPWGGEAPYDPAPVLQAATESLDQGHAESAYALFAEVLDEVPDHNGALGGLIRSLVALDRTEEAQAILDSLDPKAKADPAVERAAAALAIAADRRDPAEVQALRASAQAAPDDLAIRFELANALIGAGDRDAGAEALLSIIANDRQWEDGKARTKLLQLFETIGLEDPWVAATRRKLSAVLFG